LATPRLVALLELAAIRAVEVHLPPGAATVGTRIDVGHLAATPVGMRATIRATLREVEGRRLVFDIEGYDEAERIVEGTHERFQIDQARFLARIAQKARPPG
jgi:predicted thioesterase